MDFLRDFLSGFPGMTTGQVVIAYCIVLMACITVFGEARHKSEPLRMLGFFCLTVLVPFIGFGIWIAYRVYEIAREKSANAEYQAGERRRAALEAERQAKRKARHEKLKEQGEFDFFSDGDNENS